MSLPYLRQRTMSNKIKKEKHILSNVLLLVGESGLAALPRDLLRKYSIVFALCARGGSNPRFPLSIYKKREAHSFKCTSLGGREWIRTTEVVDNRFTVCPLWPLGNSPIFTWSWWTDSNPRPADYKSAALPTELHQRLMLE